MSAGDFMAQDLFDKFEESQLQDTAVSIPPMPNLSEMGSNSEYDAFTLKHQIRTFTWQYYASIIIFITVLIIVYSGLILSFCILGMI